MFKTKLSTPKFKCEVCNKTFSGGYSRIGGTSEENGGDELWFHQNGMISKSKDGTEKFVCTRCIFNSLMYRRVIPDTELRIDTTDINITASFLN